MQAKENLRKGGKGKMSVKDKKLNVNKGITLVALVVTIVVLLILAGITIMYVMGDNGVFGKASQSKIQTELSKIEEQAGVIYSDMFIDKQTGKIEAISNGSIVEELRKNGNEIEIRNAGTGSISEITIEPTEVSMDKSETATIKVNLKKPEDGNNYYAVIDGKRYKMNFNNGHLTIERNATNPEGNVEETANIEIVAGYDEALVTNTQINQSEKTITLSSGTTYGNTTLTIKCGSKTVECKVKVEDEIDKVWVELEAIAELIAKGEATDENGNPVTATSNSSQATVTLNEVSKTIKVGDEKYYKVKYDGEIRRVRVLGFLHDDLADTERYDGAPSATKAGISFEFLDFMTGDKYKPMKTDGTNTGGWEASDMRKFLAGTDEEGKGIKVLSNQAQIKLVKKQYISVRNDKTSVKTSNDKLWLLACSEVVNNGYNGTGTYGNAITSEGNQYKYYQGVTDAWNAGSTKRVKKTGESRLCERLVASFTSLQQRKRLLPCPFQR